MLVLLVIAVCMSGCSSKEKVPVPKTVLIMTIHDSKIYLDEVLYNVYISELDHQQYKKEYENKYGENYWNSEIAEGVTVKESLKDELYDTIIRETILYKKAIDNHILLTDEEKESCEKEALVLLESMTEEEQNIIGANQSFLKKMKEKEKLVSKYFTHILSEFNINEEKVVKDIDRKDFMSYDIQTIFFSKIEYEADGTETKKTIEQNQMGYDSLKEIQKTVPYVSDFSEILTDSATTLESEEFTFTVGDGNCEKEIEQAVIGMKPEEISDIIETDSGYYIVKFVSESSNESYETAKQDAIQQERYKQFDEYYHEIKMQMDITVTKEWEKVKIGRTVIRNPSNK